MAGKGGMSSAVTSTSDLAPEAVGQMVRETVALARATEADPAAGLPDGGFAEDIPDLELIDRADENTTADARIEDARCAEQAKPRPADRLNMNMLTAWCAPGSLPLHSGALSDFWSGLSSPFNWPFRNSTSSFCKATGISDG